jgi:hypothetical protein
LEIVVMFTVVDGREAAKEKERAKGKERVTLDGTLTLEATNVTLVMRLSSLPPSRR